MLSAVILYAEDDENDAFFAKRALDKSGLPLSVVRVSDGQEVIQYLEGEGPYSDRSLFPFPNLLLLDLKMPLMGGFDVLAWLKARPHFKSLPVIILSSSDQQEDVREARCLGAIDYFVKPAVADDLNTILLNIYQRLLSPDSDAAALVYANSAFIHSRAA